MEVAKKSLLGMNLLELKAVAKELGMPAFAGGQMAKWLYERHISTIDEMTNLAKTNREKLNAAYVIGCKMPIEAQHSQDGTIKISVSDGKRKIGRNCVHTRWRSCHTLRIITGGV